VFKDESSVLQQGVLHLESQDISQFVFENGVAKAKVFDFQRSDGIIQYCTAFIGTAGAVAKY